MAIVLLHTPAGIVEVESDTVTDSELSALGLTSEQFDRLVPVSTSELERARELLASSPDVITQPEIWELLRIFGHILIRPV